MTISLKDLWAGAIFVAFGAFFCWHAASTLTLGTALQMGPGYFPVLVGILMMLLGAATMVSSFWRERTRLGLAAWRAVALISLAIVLTGVTIERLGFVPAIALAVLISTFASRRVAIAFAVPLTIALTAFCYVVFSLALGLPFPALGSWLRP